MAHPATRLIIDGEDASLDALEFKQYRKNKNAEAVQIDQAFQVVTLEGTFDAKAGDYLMRGVEGELYSCAKSVFESGHVDWQGYGSQSFGPTTLAGGMSFVGTGIARTIQIRDA